MFHRVSYISGGCLGFLSHQQYVLRKWFPLQSYSVDQTEAFNPYQSCSMKRSGFFRGWQFRCLLPQDGFKLRWRSTNLHFVSNDIPNINWKNNNCNGWSTELFSSCHFIAILHTTYCSMLEALPTAKWDILPLTKCEDNTMVFFKKQLLKQNPSGYSKWPHLDP